MQSKDLQNIVLSKYQNGDTPTKIYHDLSGVTGLRAIKQWCQMICQTGTINLSSLPGCPRLVRTKANIKKVKDHLRRKSRVSTRKIAMELDILRIGVPQILKNGIGLCLYKKLMGSSLSDGQRVKRKKFANGARTNFRKQDTMKTLFSYENYLDIDGVYNSQNDRV